MKFIFSKDAKIINALIHGGKKMSHIPRTLKVERITIFIFFFCIGLTTKLNGPALGELKHYYLTKRIRELLIGNSRFLIYNFLNQLLYYTVQKKVAFS